MSCSCKKRIKYPNRLPLSVEKIKRNVASFVGGFPTIFIPQFTIPMLIGQGICASINETLFPINPDIATGDYLPVPHWPELDDNSDADTIIAGGGGFNVMSECGSGVDTFRFIVTIKPPTGTVGPSECQGMRYRFRFRKVVTGDASGIVDVNDLRVREGSTTRVGPFDHGVLTTSYETLTRTVSDADFDSITDFSVLQLFMDADLCADAFLDGGPEVEVAWCEIELFSK